MKQPFDVKWCIQDVEVVKNLAQRSGRILLALLEEMCVGEAKNVVVKNLYQDSANFIIGVLDGSQSLPSDVVLRHRYYDDPDALEPYPLLREAIEVFSLAIHSSQPEDWSKYVEKLEFDFTKRNRVTT